MLLAAPLAAAGPPSQGAAPPLEHALVFAQLPADAPVTTGGPRAGGMLRADYGPGCRLVRLDPDGTLTVLTEGFESACEPCVSFDGERILFAARRTAEEPWNIWEMAATGGEARQVSHEAGNCRHPAYQATLYTIDSTEPWLQVMFQSDLAGAMDELGSGPATSLYSCRADGSGLQRLTSNPSDDLDASLMSDGRVLCSAWRRADQVHGRSGRVALFALNADGSDYALYTDDGDARIRHMACDSGAGEVVFVEAEQVGWDGAGRLAAVSRRRPFHSWRALTEAGNGLYHSPAALGDGTLVVARRPADGSRTHALVHFDPASGAETPVYDDPAWHDFHARVIAPRRQPDGRSSSVKADDTPGKLYCLDVTCTSPADAVRLAPGSVQALRVIEGLPESVDRSEHYLPTSEHEGLAGPGSTVHGLAPLLGRRILATVPVESDGSFQLEVPSDRPLLLQALDGDGLALATCGWVWARPREWRGCIGCHEDPERTPENRFVEAVRKPAMVVSGQRTVTFARDLRPVVQERCASCHAAGKNGLELGAEPSGPFDRAYRSLLQARESGGSDVPVGRYVHPGQARTSPLVWLLLGRVTARPWDAVTGDAALLARHPAGALDAVTDAERRLFIEWIDLGAPWDDGPAAADESGAQSDGGKR